MYARAIVFIPHIPGVPNAVAPTFWWDDEPTVGTGDSKCGRGRRCAMSAVAQQSETYFNMAAKGQSNDLLTDAVREAVLADRDESQESEEIDEEESVNGESD